MKEYLEYLDVTLNLIRAISITSQLQRRDEDTGHYSLFTDTQYHTRWMGHPSGTRGPWSL